MRKTRVTVHFEVTKDLADGEVLCLQKCTYNYDVGGTDDRFRFIRRDKTGKLKAQRGQAGADLKDFKDVMTAMEMVMLLPMKDFLTKNSYRTEDVVG